MNKNYTKLWDTDVDGKMPRGSVQGKSGQWHRARGEPHYGFFYRIRDAWNVLWLKADALYWTIDLDK